MNFLELDTEEKSFHKTGESFNSLLCHVRTLSGLNKVRKLVFLWMEDFITGQDKNFGKKLLKNQLSENILPKSTLLENILILFMLSDNTLLENKLSEKWSSGSSCFSGSSGSGLRWVSSLTRVTSVKSMLTITQ